ncbi:uncharacterized protein LOC129576172 isoform X3 [Sitodiplosis mosellana]|nr:uncharacterized protein LOC129576172 isoform X3 [Sitodiplosis mosellana]
MNGLFQWMYIFALIFVGDAAIEPPPWSDPSRNPCANKPGGWQLLYWAPLKQCFKIYTLGYPCPDTMELTPGTGSGSRSSHGAIAECRCPPSTAQHHESTTCYKLYEQGPCDIGQYLAPINEPSNAAIIPKKRKGFCKTPPECRNGMVHWPQDSKCYTLHTRGPCPKGKLFVMGKNRLAECKCENENELAQYYYKPLGTCYEHFTVGPCEEPGKVFLPGGKCGCHVKLPNYHEDTDQCYELGTTGPCPAGHLFSIPENSIQNQYAMCQCKEGYASWSDGQCYRLYTRGPCANGEFLLNSTTCIRNPCRKGQLYFPDEKTCYKIGNQGPCDFNQVVVFDFTVRPSIDGISYNGVCGCTGIIKSLDQKCQPEDIVEKNPCHSTPGMVEINGGCYKLYTKGPCAAEGLWLEPLKILKRNDKRGAHCTCRPGYTKYENAGMTGCYAPSVGIARWFLNFLGYPAADDGLN